MTEVKFVIFVQNRVLLLKSHQNMKWIFLIAVLFTSGLTKAQELYGAWGMKTPEGENVTMIINEGYLVVTLYDLPGKRFGYTEGGKFSLNGNTVNYHCEFNSDDASQVGTQTRWSYSLSGNRLTLTGDRGTFQFDRIDKASDHAMAGTWHITERARDGVGALEKIHQTGTRKTLKILSGTRFQWVAIDPGVKGFYGTGGGTYKAENGKYVENIEFFSRDNSRVGASLEFNWKLNNGKWDHSGKSSKGDPIHEVWEKIPR